MAQANPYDSSDRGIIAVQYMVSTTNDRWLIPSTGYGDNADSVTTAQQLAQCKVVTGKKSDDITDIGSEVVV